MFFIFTILTAVSTLAGGLVGLRYKDKRHLILGFTAGVLLAVVAFDLLPEIIDLIKETDSSTTPVMIALVVGFLIFHISEKLLLIHHSQEEEYVLHKHPTVGKLSAVALAGHSFLDGVGVGLGFQLSPELGILVAVAVISHDFSDGLNTVSLVLNHKNRDRTALGFLFLVALTPLLGALSTLFFTVPKESLLLYLGFFAGFLLYIGASDILPEAHHEHSSVKTILMTIFGVLFIFGVSRII